MKEYFPHDANARSDERLLELRAEHGRAGYGTWWLLVEHLREASGYRLSNSKIGGLAMGISATPAELRAFIDYCIGLGLLCLEEEGAYFFSPALRRRMQPLDDKRQALAEAGKRGASKRWAPEKPVDSQDEALSTPPQSDPNGQVIATPLATPIASRVEENIEEEKREEERKEEENTSSLRSEVGAANAALAEAEKKIQELSRHLVQAQHRPAEEITTLKAQARGLRTPGAGPIKAAARRVTLEESEYATPEAMAAALKGTDYEHANIGHYYEEMRNWALSKGEKKIDWLAAMRGWILRASKSGPILTAANSQHANGHQSANHGNYAGSTRGQKPDARAGQMASALAGSIFGAGADQSDMPWAASGSGAAVGTKAGGSYP